MASSRALDIPLGVGTFQIAPDRERLAEMSIITHIEQPRYRANLPESWLMMVFGAIATAALMLWFSDDIGIKIIAMTLFWLVTVASVRFDISHPFVWYGGPFLLYSISAPLLLEIGLHPAPIWGGFAIQELDFSFAMDLQYLGLLVCSFVIGPDRVDVGAALRDIRRHKFFPGVTPVMVAALIVGAIGVSGIVSEGFTQKMDFILYGSWTTRLGFGFNIATTCLGVLLVKQFTENNRYRGYMTIACFLAFGLAMILVTGQRNVLFRIILVVIFTVHIAHYKISFRNLALFALLLSPLILILGSFKMAAISPSGLSLDFNILRDFDLKTITGYLGVMNRHDFINEPPLIQILKFAAFMILSSEFISASNTLAMLVSRVPYEIPFQNGWTLVNDVAEAFMPGFLMNITETNHSTYVFNRLFFPNTAAKGIGQGFSLIGSGYFNFGVAGAIGIMAVFGAALRAIYHWAAKSALGLFFFLGFVPVAIFATRGDLTMPISQGLKHILLPLLAMLIISDPIFRRKNS